MMRDYTVHYRSQLIGIFRDFTPEGALRQAKMKVGYASKYSSADDHDFIVQKVGIL